MTPAPRVGRSNRQGAEAYDRHDGGGCGAMAESSARTPPQTVEQWAFNPLDQAGATSWLLQPARVDGAPQ